MAGAANYCYTLARGECTTTGESVIKTRLYGKLAYRCKLSQPLPVLILHFTDGEYIVQDGKTRTFGCGPTKGEALAEYRRMLAATFLEFTKEEHCLSSHLQQELHDMRQYIRRY